MSGRLPGGRIDYADCFIGRGRGPTERGSFVLCPVVPLTGGGTTSVGGRIRVSSLPKIAQKADAFKVCLAEAFYTTCRLLRRGRSFV